MILISTWVAKKNKIAGLCALTALARVTSILTANDMPLDSPHDAHSSPVMAVYTHGTG